MSLRQTFSSICPRIDTNLATYCVISHFLPDGILGNAHIGIIGEESIIRIASGFYMYPLIHRISAKPLRIIEVEVILVPLLDSLCKTCLRCSLHKIRRTVTILEIGSSL